MSFSVALKYHRAHVIGSNPPGLGGPNSMKALSGEIREELRNGLVSAILGSSPDFIGKLADDTSLIRSGLIDSHRLVEISLFVEQAIGREVDFSDVDLEKEWDTINTILEFIERQRDDG